MSYAFIDEVWGSSVKKQKKIKRDATCTLYKKSNCKESELDDIMNAYMDEAPYDKYEDISYKHQKERREKDSHKISIDPHIFSYDLTASPCPQEATEEEAPTYKRKQRDLEGGKCLSEEPIDGVYEPSLRNAYDYDRYYSDELRMMGHNVNDETVETEEETCTKPKEEIYRDIVLEKYIDYLKNSEQTKRLSQKSPKVALIEMIMYLGSGVILIFMMEQILQLGSYLRNI